MTDEKEGGVDMIRKLLAGVVLTVGLLGVTGSAYAQDMEDAGLEWSADNAPPGLFCYVESPGVCVIAQTEEDCTKLGGVKTDSCPAAEKEDGE
jgi:hypothetical protein